MSPHRPFLDAARLAFAAAILSTRASGAAERNLLVFLHVAVKQRAFQSELQAALPGTNVTAVGRVADFDRSLSQGPDAVLTLPVVLAARGLAPRLRGQRQGSVDEKYSLVGADSAPDPRRVAVVGALDLLGREGTTSFVQRLVGGRPKVERVTKVEDLLPLLQMQRVEAILLPSRLFAELKAASRMNLAQRELSEGVGLPAVASLTAAGTDIAQAVSHLPAGLVKALGVDGWR